jgi:hypothetical protein
VKQLAILKIENENSSKDFIVSVDIANKLMYFIEKNGTNEPTLCLSLDSLSPEPMKGFEFVGFINNEVV